MFEPDVPEAEIVAEPEESIVSGADASDDTPPGREPGAVTESTEDGA